MTLQPWMVALVVAALSPWIVRAIESHLERRAVERTRAFLESVARNAQPLPEPGPAQDETHDDTQSSQTTHERPRH